MYKNCLCLRSAFTRSTEKVELFPVAYDFFINPVEEEQGQQPLLESGLKHCALQLMFDCLFPLFVKTRYTYHFNNYYSYLRALTNLCGRYRCLRKV